MSVRRWIAGCGAGVVLAACGGGGGNPLQPPPGPAVMAATITIVDNSFGPQTVLLTRGGTVTWVWSGANAQQHNVRWASGPVLPPGSATQATGTPYDVTFAQMGTYEFVCSLHAGMQGAVFVE